MVGSGAEINLPGAPCAADGNESLDFNLLSKKSCMGGGWLGKENQNSLAWPLSWEMLCAEPGIALAPARGAARNFAVCPSTTCRRSKLEE